MAHSERVPPAQRRLIVHCRETGGILPEDHIGARTRATTIPRMVEKGWLKEDQGAFVLTPAGEAAYPWPKSTL